MSSNICAKNSAAAREMNQVLAVPAALPNNLSSETTQKHRRPQLNDDSIEGLLLSRSAQGYLVILNKADGDLRFPLGAVKAFYRW